MDRGMTRGDDMVTSDGCRKFCRGFSAQTLDAQSAMQSPQSVSVKGHVTSKNPSCVVSFSK